MRLIAKRQAGLTMWGWLVVLALIAFFTKVALAIYPMLYNQYKITAHLKVVATDPATKDLAPADIIRTLMSRFSIDNVEHVAAKNIKITEDARGGKTIAIPYEARVPFYGPIYIVGDFTDTRVEVGHR
jgi:hypothetical protein